MNTLFHFLKERSKYVVLTSILIFSTTIITCYNVDNSRESSSKNLSNLSTKKAPSNNFSLFLANSSIDDNKIASVLINIESIEINSEEDGWFTIIDYGEEGRIVDVLLFGNGLTATLGYLNLEPGIYNQIRIHLKNDNLILINSDGNYSLLPLKIPSSEKTGVKIVRSFEVTNEGMTSITVNFDANKSIHYARGNGYIMRPTIKLDSVVTSNEITQPVHDDTGGNITVLNEIDLQIPPGAISEDTEITFKKISTQYKMPFSSTDILSDYYEFNPSGMLFSQDISITMNYLDEKISTKKISEENLKIYAIQTDNGQWQELSSSVNTSNNTVSATTNQLATYAIGGPPALAPWIDPAQVVKASNGSQSCEVPLKVKALISDADGVNKATLSYKVEGSLAFYTAEMVSVGSNWYEAEIPLSFVKNQLEPTGIEVFIEAIDNSGNVSFAPVTSSAIPHLYLYDPDLDNDSINDRWEIEMGLDITVDDSQLDPDNDGYTNYEEYVNNTDPNVPEMLPDPEDIESLCAVTKENHFWKGDDWDFAVIDTSNNVIPLTSTEFLNAQYDIDISRFYVVTTYYIRYSYKTRNTSGTIGPVNYFDPSTDVRLYDDFVNIDSFYEEFQRPDYLETWSPLPIYIQFDINYTIDAWNTRGASYSEAFYMYYRDY